MHRAVATRAVAAHCRRMTAMDHAKGKGLQGFWKPVRVFFSGNSFRPGGEVPVKRDESPSVAGIRLPGEGDGCFG